ncbi:molybdopterin molybdenumtransferase MoeA [Pedobacter ginsengisoli]|uniref:Molybdopterin molybdenumtransferase n=1 Tax=Pedobacter ginsengisoli TaxID=363852 RepID=A0A2D1U2T3_9SPHI|nr:molybdopterin molybdotransferase MoeA [Pedobacter ginsengisoli]ATP55926.1 molybdopterin molybdenumtransferase MoeA [Pedobacter ginsengisoli]
MISFEEAISTISSLAQPFEKEYISLENAENRILAENIYADRDYPPFNRAAMDGYAIMLSDWNKGLRTYSITEIIYAGDVSKSDLTSGHCYKIMTGAATPETADVIIRKEDTHEINNEVSIIAETAKHFQNIALKGQDVKNQALILSAPHKCTPQTISLLAAVGKATLQVYKLPTVAVITTGNEVIAPGKPIAAHQIRNSNQFLLKALLKKWDITPQICEHIQDNKEALTKAFKEGIKNQLAIINGGVSAGDADYVPAVLKSLGVEMIFHKVKIRPGKPLWIGKTPTGGIVFALPGNPLSCLTTFTIFVEDYLYKCFGFSNRPVYRFPLLENRIKKHQLTDFFPVKINRLQQGLNLIPYNGSGDITAGLDASGLALQPDVTEEFKKEDIISFYPFNNSL